jgi:hypothetical protein
VRVAICLIRLKADNTPSNNPPNTLTGLLREWVLHRYALSCIQATGASDKLLKNILIQFRPVSENPRVGSSILSLGTIKTK